MPHFEYLDVHLDADLGEVTGQELRHMIVAGVTAAWRIESQA